jgi:hypothetical protein
MNMLSKVRQAYGAISQKGRLEHVRISIKVRKENERHSEDEMRIR